MTRATTRAQPPPRGALVPPLWLELARPAAREPLTPVNYRVGTARRGSAAKRMGGPREGRGGARPATSNPGRAPPSPETSDLGPGRVRSQAGELGARIGDGESAGKSTAGDMSIRGAALKREAPTPSASVRSCHTSCDCYIFHRRQWLSQATGGKTGLPFTFTPPLIPASC